MADRPTIYQPFAPFVEIYIKGQDILRGRDNRPRTLISFSHDIYIGHRGGMWTLELFDPDFVATEEVLLSTSDGGENSVEVAQAAYGETAPATDQAKYWAVNGVYFRYGYVGNNPGEFITSIGPGGEKYFFGNVHAYTASYQAEGTYITLRGDSIAGGIGIAKEKTYAASYESDPYDVVKKVCDEEGWILTSPGTTSGVALLPPEKQPVAAPVTDVGIDSTEETFPIFQKKENQDSYEFLTEMTAKLRAASPEFSNFEVHWESRTDVVVEQTGQGAAAVEAPKVYCYFGPISVKEKVRRVYTYLRDAKTDIISFTPNVSVNLLNKGGTLGITYKTADARTAVNDTNMVNELNRQGKFFRPQRPPAATITSAQAVTMQKGFEKFPNETMNPEGGQTGPQVIAPQYAPDPDEPFVEETVPTQNRAEGDIQLMNSWLGMGMWALTATLEVFGDPSPEISPNNLVTVLVYVPYGEQEVRLHWVSGVWIIQGVSHTLRGGSFTTTMELGRFGITQAGITSEAFSTAIAGTLSEGAMRRSGG